LRLLFVIDHLGHGGAQKQMVTLAKGLRNRDHNVEILLYYPNYMHYASEVYDSGIKIHEIIKKDKYTFNIIRIIRGLIRERKYDLIMSFLYTPSLYTELATIGLKSTPIVVSMRSSYPKGKITIQKYLLEQFHRFAKHITVNSTYQKSLMIKIHPWIKDKISAIYNGVDLNYYQPLNNVKDSTYSNKYLVLSNTRRLKNIVGIAKALVVYQNKYGEPPTIHWAGRISASSKDIKSLKYAKSILKNNDIVEKISFLGIQDNVQELIRGYDALLLASFYEGLPNVICEAFASGVPVLASNVCEHPILIGNNERGMLFNPNDSNDIADKLYEYTITPYEDKYAMAHNARLYAENNLSIERFVSQYEELFKRIIEV
jgi:GalNAc-alpha-(1->4)-GalNAc-alpha-(1->3)-diNAcBac-PP-undecaprenol alpha-1,4-N-acetyl-D-galactosaminyltransferase